MRAIDTKSHLDYFTASYLEIKSPRDLSLLSGMFDTSEPTRPMPHYDLAWRLKCGGLLNLAHGEHQGARIDLGGQALQACRDAGMRDTEVIGQLSDPAEFRRVTRLDYCWDIANAGSVRHCANLWEAGKCKTTLRGKPSGYINYGTRSGRTIYFGSSKSSQRVRIYDKGAELKLLNQALLRVELQVRTPHSEAMHTDIITSNLRDAARSRLASVLDFPTLQWWQQGLSGNVQETGTIPKKAPKWQQVYMQQVSDSIIKHWTANEGNDREFISQWLKGLTHVISNLE